MRSSIHWLTEWVTCQGEIQLWESDETWKKQLIFIHLPPPPDDTSCCGFRRIHYPTVNRRGFLLLACSPPETEFLVIFQFTAMEMFPTAMAINFGYIPSRWLLLLLKDWCLVRPLMLNHIDCLRNFRMVSGWSIKSFTHVNKTNQIGIVLVGHPPQRGINILGHLLNSLAGSVSRSALIFL